MRWSIPVFLFFAIISSTFGVELKVSFHPREVTVGDVCYMDLISIGNLKPDIPTLPIVSGLTWGKDFKRFSTRNSDNYNQEVLRCPFTTSKDGKLVIPPFEVTLGSEKVLTRPYFMKVRKQSRRIDLSNYVFAKIRHSREKAVVGELINVVVELYSRSGLKVKSIEPHILGVNKCQVVDKPKMLVVKDPLGLPKTVDMAGCKYEVTSFITRIKPVVVGKGEVSFLFVLGISVPVKRSGGKLVVDKRFFSGYTDPFAQYETFVIKLDNIEMTIDVSPLPYFESGTQFVGLVGEWKLTTELISNKDGHGTNELLLNAVGYGDPTEFKPPNLDAVDTRVFPPEVTFSKAQGGQNHITTRYALLPLVSGAKQINLAASVYSVKQKKYIEFHFHHTLHCEADEISRVEESNVVKKSSIQSDAIAQHITNLNNGSSFLEAVLLLVLFIVVVGIYIYCVHEYLMLLQLRSKSLYRLFRSKSELTRSLMMAKGYEFFQLINCEVRERLLNFYGLNKNCPTTELVEVVGEKYGWIIFRAEQVVYSDNIDVEVTTNERVSAIELVRHCLCLSQVLTRFRSVFLRAFLSFVLQVLILYMCFNIGYYLYKLSNENQYVVIRDSILYELPSEYSNILIPELHAGQIVSVKEICAPWSFIKTSRGAGWVKDNGLVKRCY